MSGIVDLNALLSSMEPMLIEGEFTFVTLPGHGYGAYADLNPIAAIQEDEGLTLIVPLERADEAGLESAGIFSMITLNVHSSLEAVGLTAAVSDALAKENISANMIAGFYHDHIFVPVHRAGDALRALMSLTSSQ